MKVPEIDATWARQALRDVALRATAARVAVLKLLASAGSPMSHGEVVEALTEFGFDQSTLFRCLNESADAGLVSRIDLGGHARRFELRRSDGEGELTHPHFICVDCGELTCLKDFSVQIASSRGPLSDQLGTITEIMVRGHCRKCKTS